MMMRPMFAGLMLAACFVATSPEASAQEGKPGAATASAAKRPKSRSDVAVGAALARLDDSFTLSAAQAPVASESQAASAPVPTAAPRGAGLAEIHVAKVGSGGTAGVARDVRVESSASKAEKPMASVRHHRKLGVAAVLASAAPALAGCRSCAGAALSVPVRIDIAPDGAVERAEVAENPTAGGQTAAAPTGPVASCVAAAFVSARFGAPGGQGVRLVIPVALSPAPAESATKAP